LGLRHTHHGIPHAAYRFAEQALLQTLAEMLGPAFTPDVEQAWQKLFDCLTSAMTSG
jgi:hemoglobin-like flavoprotein